MSEVQSLQEQINQLSRKRLREINRAIGISTGRNKQNSVTNLLNWVLQGFQQHAA